MNRPRESRARLIAAANMIDVSVPAMPVTKLIRDAVAHYNERNPHKPPADFAADETFVSRICVNYLRHACSAYDRNRDFLRGIASDADRAAVGAVIKGRTLRAIANTYPILAAEAEMQAVREDAAWRGARSRGDAAVHAGRP
jgi:hypothetical protein